MVQLSADAFAYGGDLMRVEQALALLNSRIPPIALQAGNIRQRKD
jgi:molybdopterin molybdotransferase